MTEPRGRGYLPDPIGWQRLPRFIGRAPLAVSRDELPSEALGWLEKTPPIRDQGATSKCTGAAWARLASTVTGLDFSDDAAYTIARLTAAPGQPMRDEGAYPWAAALGIGTWGLPLREAWELGINEMPTIPDLSSCERFNQFEPTRISAGESRVLEVASAVAFVSPVVLAIASRVPAFDDYKGGVLPALEGEPDHYVTLVGWRLVDGRFVFHGANSWGTGWGLDGFFEADEDFVASAQDLYYARVRR